MDILTKKLIERSFSVMSNLKTAKNKTAGFIKRHPTVPISAASLGVSSVNMGTNMSRHDKDRVYQEQELKAINTLSNNLLSVNKTLTTPQSTSVMQKKTAADTNQQSPLDNITTTAKGVFSKFRRKVQ